MADLNGDGKKDLVTANSANTVSVLLGNGDGSFAAMTDFAVGVAPRAVAVADLNRDGKQDLVTANADANAVSVLLGNGHGSFAAKADFAVGVAPRAVAVGDFNGDGNKDLVTANGGAGAPAYGTKASVLLGNGAGRFARRADFIVGMVPASVVVGDFNGDGKQDFVTANETANSVSVMLNTTKPGIASLTPTRGRVGTTLTITGSRAGWTFGATRGTSKVYFGAKAVTKYVSWSKYQIKVRVPSLSKGKKAVTVKTPAGKSNVKYFTVL